MEIVFKLCKNLKSILKIKINQEPKQKSIKSPSTEREDE